MNPDRIRALLDGITEGDLTYSAPSKVRERMMVHVGWMPQKNADLYNASPGIARYALELAAALERIRDQSIVEVKTGVLNHEGVNSCGHVQYLEDPRAIALAALAPQPAPTDGAG